MRVVFPRLFCGFIAAILAVATPSYAQQDPFRWMDFHSQKDQDIIVWVTRSLSEQDWTAIREIGVQYDAALVVTTYRATPQSPANNDTFTVWSVSLTSHVVAPLLKGVNLRWLERMRFAPGAPLEPAILYDNCRDCAAQTYFTAFYYDLSHHVWAARWMRGSDAAPVWSANPPTGVNWTQVCTAMADPDGRELVGAWNHIDYGSQKPPEDYVYRYDLDPLSGQERTQLLTGAATNSLEQRLCGFMSVVPDLSHGQDSWLCRQTVQPSSTRKPVTTPPANNHGQAAPPGTRH